MARKITRKMMKREAQSRLIDGMAHAMQAVENDVHAYASDEFYFDYEVDKQELLREMGQQAMRVAKHFGYNHIPDNLWIVE